MRCGMGCETDELADVCVKVDEEGRWREMVVISADAKELSFIHLKGSVSMADLSQLGGLGSAAPPPADPKLQHR